MPIPEPLACLVEGFRRRLRGPGAIPGSFRSVKRVNLAEYRRAYEEGRSVVSHRPLEIFLGVSTVCNTQCVFCPRFHGEYGGHVVPPPDPTWHGDMIMKKETMETVVPFFDSSLLVHPFGVGEPTLNRDLPWLIRAIGEAGAWCEFFTNGQGLTKELAEAVVRAGVRRIYFSINAASPSLYESIHRGGRLALVIEGWKEIRAARERYKSDIPHLMINFVAMEENMDELPDLVRLAGCHGVEAVEVKVLVPFANRPEMISMRRIHDPKRDAAILDETRKVASETGVHLFLDQYLTHRPGQDPDRAPGKPDRPVGRNASRCFFPWRSLSVNSGGYVQPCCFYADPHFLGNVKEAPIEDIWNGESYRELRRSIARGVTPEGCRFCIENGQRPSIDNIEDYLL